MRPRTLRLLLACVAALLLLSLGSCGGSDSLIQIKGSSEAITKPLLDHWMGVTVATDYNTYVHATAPAGLASEPADYPRCAEAAKKIIPRSGGKPKLSDAEISVKCHELHHAIKTEALTFLLNVQWNVLEGEEEGVRVSDDELRKELQRFREKLYKSAAGERKYLRERGMTVDDAMYQLKRTIFYTRLKPKFRAEVAKAGGGQSAYVRLATSHYDGLIARTSCKPGYVVLGCKGYREPAQPAVPAWVTLEAFAAGKG